MSDEKITKERICERGSDGRNESNNHAVYRATNAGSILAKVDNRVRKRRRPRTKAFRIHMKDEIEKALCSRLSPLHHITFTTDENGRLSAPLDDVVASLGLDGDRYRALSRTALIKLGDISTLFTIDYLSDIRPHLCINDTKMNSDTSTVYVDNLPRSCDLISLYRRAATFGTVVSLHPLFVSKRSRHRHSSFVNDQSPSSSAAQLPNADQHVQAAFIQFVEQRSANKFCEAYSRNWPARNVCKRRKIRKAKRSIIGKRRYRAKTMAKHSVTAELKKSRKRKRTSDVSDEASPLKRSRSCLEISECSNNVGVHRREIEDEELCSSTSDNKVVCHADEGNSVITPTGNAITRHARNRRRERVKKRRRTKFKSKYKVLNLTRYFRRIQVLSLKTFKELRMKYLLLKKESFKKLKADLACVEIPMNFIEERGKNRRVKRGRARLMSRVSRLREWHDENMQSSSSTSVVDETGGNSRKSDHESPRIIDGHAFH
uniref:Uncharacterized protein n=1 Tax=Parascaris univalens TaxID=6257 RepID=A0A915B7Y2_PARUN